MCLSILTKKPKWLLRRQKLQVPPFCYTVTSSAKYVPRLLLYVHIDVLNTPLGASPPVRHKLLTYPQFLAQESSTPRIFAQGRLSSKPRRKSDPGDSTSRLSGILEVAWSKTLPGGENN